MTLQQLKYFITVAEALHFTKAAQQLYISQPSLSRSVSELERELGAPLFSKDGRKTILTEYGRAFLPHAQSALAELDKGQLKISKIQDMELGNVELGYFYSIGFDYVPRMLEAFYRDTGKNDITFSFYQGMNGNLVDKLLDGTLDLALASDPGLDTIAAVKVMEQELFVLLPGSHPLAGRERVALEEIQDEKFISLIKSSGVQSHINKAFEAITRKKPQVVFEVAECNAMAAFVNARMGIAISPRIPALEDYNIKTVRIENNCLRRDISLMWKHGDRMSVSATAFRDYIIDGLHSAIWPTD